MRRWIPLLLMFLSLPSFAQATVNGPANAKAGAQVEVTVDGLEEPPRLRDDRGEGRGGRLIRRL